MDATRLKIKGQWKCLYRAVDSKGHVLDLMFSAKRDAQAAKQFSVRS